MDNDSLLILKKLFEDSIIEPYQVHREYKIPPSTLFCVLEGLRGRGYVERQGYSYLLTPTGEAFLSTKLGPMVLKPSVSFKDIPPRFLKQKETKENTSIINEIVQ